MYRASVVEWLWEGDVFIVNQLRCVGEGVVYAIFPFPYYFESFYRYVTSPAWHELRETGERPSSTVTRHVWHVSGVRGVAVEGVWMSVVDVTYFMDLLPKSADLRGLRL
jgi:hypothetical protein